MGAVGGRFGAPHQRVHRYLPHLLAHPTTPENWCRERYLRPIGGQRAARGVVLPPQGGYPCQSRSWLRRRGVSHAHSVRF
jgi:hypothetical protein